MSGCIVHVHLLVGDAGQVTRVRLVGDEPLEGLTEEVKDLLGAQSAEVGGPVTVVVVAGLAGGRSAGSGGGASRSGAGARAGGRAGAGVGAGAGGTGRVRAGASTLGRLTTRAGSDGDGVRVLGAGGLESRLVSNLSSNSGTNGGFDSGSGISGDGGIALDVLGSSGLRELRASRGGATVNGNPRGVAEWRDRGEC
jgi:hypothetical protein